MTKPFGYFGLSQDNPLIQDITETFGDGASAMSEDDCLWIISRIAHILWLESDYENPPTAEAEEIVDRLHELKRHEKIALLRALSQPN
ncbi:hypothetical protein NIES2100_73740 [Calothrix sp. NIES-2100]|uniref:hypothetical protein n=1 Tax=Calothrix sp. NIES-2100 TaxID=1954172 RepID=UPI000B5E2F39|nr:hypothetical protein NIES2100_73740 [Calothrix sp. NIES-2100]